MPKNAGSMQEKDIEGLAPNERSPSTTNVIYTHLVAGELNELDKVARYILAVAFSSQYPGNSREQMFISQRTVAVASHNGKLYVASNGLYGGEPDALQKGNVAAALRAEGVMDEIVYLANWSGFHGLGESDYHAEMQIVDYFYLMRIPLPQIGVSKPCCGKCKERLDSLGIDYSYWHTQGTGSSYKYPKATAKWW